MQKHISTALALVLLLVPLQAVAATLTTLDTLAGIASEVRIEGADPNEQIQLSVVPPIGQSFSEQLTADETGVAQQWIPGEKLQKSGTYTLDATLSTGKKTAGSLQVHPDSIDLELSFLDASTPSVQEGGEVVITVVAIDQFGNPLTGRSMELISNRKDDYITPIDRETNRYGEQQFSVQLHTRGVATFRAVDLIGGVTLKDVLEISVGTTEKSMGGTTMAYTAPTQFYSDTNGLGASVLSQNPYRAQTTPNPAPILSRIKMSILKQESAAVPELRINEAESMIIEALDQYGSRFFDFEGTVYMATTDPLAELPKDGIIHFGFTDQGMKQYTLGLTFGTSGTHTIILTRSPNEVPSDLSQALGVLTVNVVGQGPTIPSTNGLKITSPAEGETVTDTNVFVEGTGPAFINISIQGGIETVRGETDRDGNFSLPITLDEHTTEHTIQVIDPDGRYRSGERYIILDNTPPEISSITITPENPVEGSDVLLVVQTDETAENVSMDIDGEILTLMTTDEGTYKFQKLFTAPEAGQYDLSIVAKDALGNTATQTQALHTTAEGLPTIQNLIATAQPSGVALRWDPVTGDTIDGYRIYIGTEPGNWETLDTDQPTAAATVAGLKAGETYYFAVTAIEGDRESEELSSVASAVVLGIDLQVSPKDGALFLEWNSLSKDLPLSSFVLEFGVDPGEYSEQRSLNGELRAYTLRDLINGIPYYVKITPITTTGERMDELSTTGQGTPSGSKFTPSASDPVPSSLHSSATPPPTPPKNVPLSQQGLPAWLIWTTLVASLVAFWLYNKHRQSKHMTIAFLNSMESHYQKHQ